MEKITKKSLRERWKNSSFIDQIDISREIDIHLLNNIDLRGINLDEFIFPKIIQDKLENIDLSYGKGSLSIIDSEIKNLQCVEFKFDKSSWFSKTKIIDSSFHKAHFNFNFTDIIFENCDFSKSIFKGGFQECGFRRCIFSNCNFTEAQWKNLYLLANQFLDCNFSEFTIYNAGIRGFKTNTNLENIKDIFTNSDVQGLIKLK